MFPDLDLPAALDQTTRGKAATTLRNTGARLTAPTSDVDLVLSTVFGEIQS